MLDAQWIVQIYSKDEANDWCIGTGYFINDGLILTARHNILSGNSISSELKLVFPERDNHGKLEKQGDSYVYIFENGLFFSSENIIFPDDEQLDLAVIRCPNFLNFIPPAVQLANNLPPLNKECNNTLGFPRAGKVANFQRELLSFPLKRLQGTTGDNILILHSSVQLDSDLFTNKNGWGGLSGSPVFYEEQLVAVIIKTYDSLQSYFYAVSIPWVKEHCKEFCEAIKPPIDEEVIKQQTEKLHKVIKTNIEKLLKRNFNLDNLADSFTLPNDAEISYHSIAECLTKQSTRESIAVLIRILRKNQPKNLDDMQEIAGWLLLNSIDSTWWFENEPRMQQTIAEFNLKVSEYFETIISRHALQPAKYTLNFNHTDKSKPSSQEKPYPKPYKEGNKEKKKILVIDADENATDEQLLIPIYKDLWHQNQDIKDDDIKFPVKELLDLIIESADGERIINEGKLVYYLVEKNYLDLLKSKSWFHEKEQLLTNCLRFICCNTDKPEHQEKPCTEGEGFVLSELAKLLQIIEPVKQNEQSQT
jgi:hypothetical protein